MNKRDCPDCPKCNSNANVVQLVSGFICAFCETKFYEKEEGGQQKLF